MAVTGSIESLEAGDVLNNTELCGIFGCSPQGGMRRSLKTNTLVLITNHLKSIYEDRWDGTILHYTGMGQNGDMDISHGQNKTLANIPGNGVTVHLFEVFKDKEYTYSGNVEKAGPPYQAKQHDVDGNERLVWVFPLKSSDTLPAEANLDLQETLIAKERKARKLSEAELIQRAKDAPSTAGRRTVSTVQHARSPYISELAKRRANGHCELCGQQAPFESAKNVPYLECHHIEWLARGGQDTIDNTVALCPNCHRRMHILDDSDDVLYLKVKAKSLGNA